MNKVILVMCTMALTMSAYAADNRKRIKHIATQRGTCEKLVLGDKDLTRACQTSVAQIEYTDGTLNFSYSAGRDFVVTFAGNGKRQVHDGPDVVVTPIDVIFSSIAGAQSRPSKAVGACRFTNPWKGPAIMNCSAKVDGMAGMMVAEFVTDGSEPVFLPTN